MSNDAFRDYERLSSKLELLKDECAVLSSELIHLATEIESGRLTDLKFTAEKITALDVNFEAYRKEVLLFTGMSETASDADSFTTLQSMEPLLQSFHADIRQEALRILDEVQTIFHKEDRDFPPLQECRTKAKELQRAITEIDLPGLHPEVSFLIDGSHPFSELIALIRHHQHLNEEQLAEREKRMNPYFGKLLFIALIRDNLFFPAEPVSEPIAVLQTAPSNFYVIENKSELQKPDRESSIPEVAVAAVTEDRFEQRRDEVPTPKAVEIPAITPKEPEWQDLAFKQMLKKDKNQETREYLRKDLINTRTKLERALKYDFIEKIEYEWLAGIIQEIETGLPEKLDFREDQKKLLSVRTTLDEKELNTIETKRRAMRQEFQQISHS
jgi:hypothetical protein